MASSARIDELRKKFDENPRRYFAPLANEYRKAGDPEQAIFICEEYLPQQPGHMSGHIVYGQALFELNRHDDARGVFETALSLDPENLIALRHLGDIARQGGDATTARMWYQRVLEADPRNEEIAQLMLSLLNDDQSAPAAASLSPTPLSSAVVIGPTDEIALVPVEQQAAVEKSIDPPMPDVPPAPVFEETRRVSPHAPKESDLLDLDDFDLGGVPLSELRAASATPTYQPAQPFDPSQPFDESKASGIAMPDMVEQAGGDSGTESSSFEAGVFTGTSDEIEKDDDTPIGASSESNIEPFVESFISTSYSESSYHDIADEPAAEHQAADLTFESTMESAVDSSVDASSESFEPGFVSGLDVAPEPVIESAADLHLGLSDDGTSETTVGDESDTAASTMAGLETFEAGVFSAAPVAPVAIETDSFFETPPVSDDPPGSYVSSELAQSELAEEAGVGEPMDFSDSIGDVSSIPPVSDQAEAQAHVPEADVLDFERESFGARESIEAVESSESADAVDAGDTIDAIDAIDAIDSIDSIDSIDDVESVDVFETFESFETSDARVEVPTTDSVVESFANQNDDAEQQPTVEVFVTETMAQLYLEQGHLDAAIGIYRRLVEQRPDDEDLAARMDAIEERMAVTSTDSIDDGMYVDESLAQLAADIAPARASGGPTIREFLSGLVMRTPGGVAVMDSSVDVADTASDDRSADYFETSLDDFGGFQSEPETEARHPAPVGDVVAGSLDALFSGADATDTDTAAADTLAQAFAPETPAESSALIEESSIVEESPVDESASVVAAATDPELEGAPAHRAADELSLDHVFKTNNAPRAAAEGDGFSFDQFFSDEVAEGAAETSPESSATAPQGADDIAQFNAWLNGLKKS